jgi:hypothetical protein
VSGDPEESGFRESGFGELGFLRMGNTCRLESRNAIFRRKGRVGHSQG